MKVRVRTVILIALPLALWAWFQYSLLWKQYDSRGEVIGVLLPMCAETGLRIVSPDDWSAYECPEWARGLHRNATKP